MSPKKLLAVLSAPPNKSSMWLSHIGVGKALQTTSNYAEGETMIQKYGREADGLVS